MSRISAGAKINRREFARLVGGGLYLTSSLARGTAEAANEGPIRFVNAAPGAGLDFVLNNGATGHK